MNREIDERRRKAEDSRAHHTKAGHNKQPTACSDMRRRWNSCGICSSENVVWQGVDFCHTCGVEVIVLSKNTGYRFHRDIVQICNCPQIIKKTKSGYEYKTTPRDEIGVDKCCDCGAIKSRGFCPNCTVPAWKHWDGRTYCGKCGYKIDEPTEKGQLVSNRKKKRLAAKNAPHPNRI